MLLNTSKASSALTASTFSVPVLPNIHPNRISASDHTVLRGASPETSTLVSWSAGIHPPSLSFLLIPLLPSVPPPAMLRPRLWLPCLLAGFSYPVPLGPTYWRYWTEWDVGGGGETTSFWVGSRRSCQNQLHSNKWLTFLLPATLGDHSIHTEDFTLPERTCCRP